MDGRLLDVRVWSVAGVCPGQLRLTFWRSSWKAEETTTPVGDGTGTWPASTGYGGFHSCSRRWKSDGRRLHYLCHGIFFLNWTTLSYLLMFTSFRYFTWYVRMRIMRLLVLISLSIETTQPHPLILFDPLLDLIKLWELVELHVQWRNFSPTSVCTRR